LSFEEIHPLGINAAFEYVVQTGVPGGNPGKLIYL
jgi:hypothetical protein